MNYLALGDSISIDDYTNVAGGGAASQFAHRIGATQFQDLTQDGLTTEGVWETLEQIEGTPDVVTLTAGGNDFLRAASGIISRWPGASWTWDAVGEEIFARLRQITAHLKTTVRGPILLNTLYDPTDGDDSLLIPLGLPQPAHARAAFNAINDGIRRMAQEPPFLLADLERLFHGHGALAPDTWFVLQIEPNFAGATAIADEWHRLYSQA